MGAFKGVGHEQEEQIITAEIFAAGRFAFDEFDPVTQGGLYVMPTGQLAEIRHPSWVADEPDDYLKRTILLPIWAQMDGDNIVGYELDQPEFELDNIPLGGEFEAAPTYKDAEWAISPDGVTVIYPDGITTTLKLEDLDPEALRFMIEFKSDVAEGFPEHCRNVIEATLRFEKLLQSHNLTHAGLAIFPKDYHKEDATKLAFVLNILDRMYAREFGVMSNQLHVQMIKPEAALHALNIYQSVQALFGLITAAAPVRDGSLDTTIGEHYQVDVPLAEKKARALKEDDYPEPDLPVGDFGRLLRDDVPYDWRELARILGSPSSGSYAEAAPVNFIAALRLADLRLRDGSIVSTARVFGPHADRFRADKRTVEINNMGPAGGNIYKTLAAQEVVAKYVMSLQLEYLEMTEEERQSRNSEYQMAISVGHMNNIAMALQGKDPNLRFTDQFGRERTPAEMLNDIINFVDIYADRYNFTPVSQDSINEMAATISTDPLPYTTVRETFEAFFQPGSRMTATDALRHAHSLAPSMGTKRLLARFSAERRAHVFAIAEALDHGEDDIRLALGDRALAAVS